MKRNFRKAFTLIEILVATAIFATIMIIVVATFSWAAGYNNRLTETRRVGQEIRNAMDMITRDIRLASGSGSIDSTSIGEITLYLCSGIANSTCQQVSTIDPIRYKDDLATTTDPSGTAPKSNGILILQQEGNNKKAIFYRSVLVSGTNYKIVRSELSNLSSWSGLTLAGVAAGAASLHPDDPNNNGVNMQIWLGGFAAAKTDRKQQPYAEIYLIGQTPDYEAKQPNMRSKFHLKTTIETRDYNP